jgi:GTP-binding protein
MQQHFGTAKYLCSAGNYNDLPEPIGDEFALLGRSNVGKSSFINHACAQGNLAKTSKRPGTTLCANIYKVTETLCWVDMPGYGFASASRHERERWSTLIYEYCRRREKLKGILWLLDIRHIGLEMDCEAWEWLTKLGKPVLPVLAKADKLPRSGQKKQKQLFAKRFGGMGEPVLFSVLEHPARERFWERFDEWRKTTG